MKKMLCLQDVSGVSEVDLAERSAYHYRLKACRTEECERRFEIDGEEAVLRCRETELQPPVKNSELRLLRRRHRNHGGQAASSSRDDCCLYQ
ncbi:MAG: hypothetical protein ACLRXQ_05285 [Phascolarctobacterium faecium]